MHDFTLGLGVGFERFAVMIFNLYYLCAQSGY
jgi:hypothetical protein